MNIYIDKLDAMLYGLPMKDIKYLLKQLDGQIATLQKQRSILQQALEIREQHGNINPSVPLYDDRGTSNFLDSERIEKAILKINGDFKKKDVPAGG